jgi:hypothetical protein
MRQKLNTHGHNEYPGCIDPHFLCPTRKETTIRVGRKHVGRIRLRLDINTYIHTYHSRFIPEGVAEVSQIFFRDTYVLPKLIIYEKHCRRGRW